MTGVTAIRDLGHKDVLAHLELALVSVTISWVISFWNWDFVGDHPVAEQVPQTGTSSYLSRYLHTSTLPNRVNRGNKIRISP